MAQCRTEANDDREKQRNKFVCVIQNGIAAFSKLFVIVQLNFSKNALAEIHLPNERHAKKTHSNASKNKTKPAVNFAASQLQMSSEHTKRGCEGRPQFRQLFVAFSIAALYAIFACCLFVRVFILHI